MENFNWKKQVASAINNMPIEKPVDAGDNDLAAALRDKLASGTLHSRDAEFGKSLLNGFIKWGHFTDAQRPHVRNLINPPPEVAEDHEHAAVLRDLVMGHALSGSDLSFAESLLRGYDQYGKFTPGQRPYVGNLIASVKRRLELDPNEAGKALPSPVVSRSEISGTGVAGQAKIAPRASTAPNICGTVHPDRFARFTVGDLQLSLKNDGSLIWVKWKGQVAGSLDPATGAYRETTKYLSRDELDRCLLELVRIEHDPVKAARENGVLTGRCSCCGRTLTDPISIAYGIGPVCRSRWGVA